MTSLEFDEDTMKQILLAEQVTIKDFIKSVHDIMNQVMRLNFQSVERFATTENYDKWIEDVEHSRLSIFN